MASKPQEHPDDDLCNNPDCPNVLNMKNLVLKNVMHYLPFESPKQKKSRIAKEYIDNNSVAMEDYKEKRAGCKKGDPNYSESFRVKGWCEH